MLQNELLEIVKIKSESFKRRYQAEFKTELDEKYLSHEIKPIDDDMMNLHFDSAGNRIIDTFHSNIQKLREFLSRVDKDHEEVFFDDGDLDQNNDFASIKSVNNLKGLLQNYRCVTEA